MKGRGGKAGGFSSSKSGSITASCKFVLLPGTLQSQSGKFGGEPIAAALESRVNVLSLSAHCPRRLSLGGTLLSLRFRRQEALYLYFAPGGARKACHNIHSTSMNAW